MLLAASAPPAARLQPLRRPCLRRGSLAMQAKKGGKGGGKGKGRDSGDSTDAVSLTDDVHATKSGDGAQHAAAPVHIPRAFDPKKRCAE
jgi:hypothetical protein